jgi:hypothetical protein
MTTKGVLYIATGARRFTLEAIRSARTLRYRLADVEITLFTDFLHEDLDEEYPVFSDVVVRPEMVARDLKSKSDWGSNLLSRIEALQHTPYDHTLHIDADTLVLDEQFGNAFDWLDSHELILCPASRETSRSAGMIDAPIYYIGFIGYDITSGTVKDLLNQWVRTFRACLTARNRDQLPSGTSLLSTLSKADRHFLLSTAQYSLSRLLRPDHNPENLDILELDAELWNHHTPVDQPGIVLQANPLIKFNARTLNSYGHFQPFYSMIAETFLGYSELERKQLADVIRKYAVPESEFKSGHGLRTQGNLFEQNDVALEQFRQRVEPHITGALKDLFRRSNNQQKLKLRLHGWGYVLAGSGYIESHQHTSATLSLTYYVSIPPSISIERQGGALQVFNPISSEGFLIKSGQMTSKVAIYPQNDSLVIFPSNLWHAVTPVPDGGERIALTIDVINYA